MEEVVEDQPERIVSGKMVWISVTMGWNGYSIANGFFDCKLLADRWLDFGWCPVPLVLFQVAVLIFS